MDRMMDRQDAIWDYLVDNEIATKDEIALVTSINGYNEEALNDILFCRTGYRSVEQITEMEND